MKAEGIEYDERMALLEEITWPRPLADVLAPAFRAYCETNPWVADAEIAPKSVVRDMLERAMTFGEFVSRYGLERSEGVVLRYVSDAYRALRQVVPEEHRTEEIEEIVEWLGELVRGVDSSLLDEWERLAGGDEGLGRTGEAESVETSDALIAITTNERSFRRLVRNAMFRLVELAAQEKYEALAAASGAPEWDADAWEDALDPLFVEQGDDAIGFDASARAASLLTIWTPGAELPPGTSRMLEHSPAACPPDTWIARQVLDDYDKHHDWSITAVIDLPASDESGAVALKVISVAPAD